MRKTLMVVTILVALTGSISAQQGVDWSQYGFKAEPGAAVGTPCVLNLMARFWYRNFGISTCGIYLPSGVNFLNGNGFEGDVMYRLIQNRRGIEPYVAVGYGFSDISSTQGSSTIRLITQYAGLQVGAYYNGAFAQVGVGYGKFQVNSSKLLVVPLLQIGYNFAIGATGGTGGGGGGTK